MALVRLKLYARIIAESVDDDDTLYVILHEEKGERRYIIHFPIESSFCFFEKEWTREVPGLYRFFLQTWTLVGMTPKRVTILSSPDDDFVRLEIDIRHEDGREWRLPISAVDGLNIAFESGCPLLMKDEHLTLAEQYMGAVVDDLLQENEDQLAEERPVLTLEDAERRIREEMEDDLPQA